MTCLVFIFDFCIGNGSQAFRFNKVPGALDNLDLSTIDGGVSKVSVTFTVSGTGKTTTPDATATTTTTGVTTTTEAPVTTTEAPTTTVVTTAPSSKDREAVLSEDVDENDNRFVEFDPMGAKSMTF